MKGEGGFEINHNKHLSDVLSHAKCPRCNSNDKEAIASVGDNYNLRCKNCGSIWTESSGSSSFGGFPFFQLPKLPSQQQTAQENVTRQ